VDRSCDSAVIDNLGLDEEDEADSGVGKALVERKRGHRESGVAQVVLSLVSAVPQVSLCLPSAWR
jgi:hypothetical protein